MIHLPEQPSVDSFDELPERVQELIKATSREMQELAYQFVAPISLLRLDENRSLVDLNSATAVLVRLEEQSLLLTAEHVVTKFQKAWDDTDSGSTEFKVGDQPLSMVQRKGWRADHLDVVALEVDEHEVQAIGVSVYQLHSSVRHQLPPEGAYVIVCGFPKYGRHENHSGGVHYGAQGMILSVTSSSSDHIVCQFQRNEWIEVFGTGIMDPHTPMGGISGAPAFLVGEFDFPLVGIATEFSESFELLRIETIEPIFGVGVGKR